MASPPKLAHQSHRNELEDADEEAEDFEGDKLIVNRGRNIASTSLLLIGCSEIGISAG